jgi:23S rRNA-/tRNA-specific pseudouridylate synthase
MGHPILGDPQYGGDDFGQPHQILCAKSLAFDHPITGESIYLESAMDAALKER